MNFSMYHCPCCCLSDFIVLGNFQPWINVWGSMRSIFRALISICLTLCFVSSVRAQRLDGPGMILPGQISPLWRSTQEARDAMIRISNVKYWDIVYDLGSGTGELVADVARTGAKSVGIEIQPQLASLSQHYINKLGLRAVIWNQDFFDSDFSDATVVMLFLGSEANLKLLPKLRKTLRNGTLIVSNTHDMGHWKPDRVAKLSDGHEVFLWFK